MTPSEKYAGDRVGKICRESRSPSPTTTMVAFEHELSLAFQAGACWRAANPNARMQDGSEECICMALRACPVHGDKPEETVRPTHTMACVPMGIEDWVCSTDCPIRPTR